jgi:hypothetical protein
MADRDRAPENERGRGARFISEAPERTHVELEHRYLERHAEGWEQTRDAVGSEGGWPGCLRSFAERLAA